MGSFHVAFSSDLLTLDGRPGLPAEVLQEIEQAPGVTSEFLREKNVEITPEQIRGVNALGLQALRLTSETLSHGAADLLFVSRFGVGYENVDLPACTAAGVAVSITRGATNFSMAQGALTLMLALTTRLLPRHRQTTEGQWHRRGEIVGSEIRGKVLGIVGLGEIGRELARLVSPFAMRLLAFDPYADPQLARRLGVELVSLDEILTQADYISVHCNLSPETRGLIGARELRLMKPTAYLMNLARGPVIDQRALTQALAERWIAGAGLDVFEVEPLAADDPLTRLDNVILTPHTIGGTHEGVAAVASMAVGKILQIARGEVPEYILNREVLQTAAFQDKLAKWRRPAVETTANKQ